MISAHMWVQNEEDYIAASILSIYELVDEIVVILNPSTDRTPEILAMFDKVRIIPNDGDWLEIGEHILRNRGLAECKGEYIMVWDADEVLYEDQEDAILASMDDDCIGCWRFTQLEFYGDHFHLQDQYRGLELDGEGVIVPGYGRQVVHGHPIIYRNHPDLRYVENSAIKYGRHSSIRGTQIPNTEMYCHNIYYAHYGNCRSNERLYNRTIAYFEAVKDPDDICHTEEYLSQIDPDNPLGYHPDQAVRPFFGRHPKYMEGNPVMFHRIKTRIDEEGKARVVSRSDSPLPVEINIGTPADCGRVECNYDPPDITVELKRAANEFTVIKALDYYTSTAELCMIHPNVFVMLNENIPNNPQFSPESSNLIHDIIHQNARHFVAASESVRNALLIEGVPIGKISVINFWGCDTSFWRILGYTLHDKDRVRSEFDPGISRNMVLFVGRIEDQKGIKYLLDTMQMLPDNVSIVLAGEGNFDQFPSNVDPEYHNRIFYLGNMNEDQLLQLYNVSRLLVLPSIPTATWIEQFGRVLTEAMACGIPCIATDVGGPRDIVIDGVTGFLVRPADSMALADKINYILTHTDEAIRMGIAGKEVCCAKFSDDVSSMMMRKCIEEYMWR